MNPYLNWSATTSPQPMVFTPSRCSVTTPRSLGTALTAASSSSLSTASCTTASSSSTNTMSSPEQEMATTGNNVKNAYKSSAPATSSSSSSNCATCADAATAATSTGYRRPRPVSASSDRRECLLDRIAVMRQQESTPAYKTCDYFASTNRKNSSTSSSSSSSSSPAPDASCRAKMVQWCTQVTDYCEFSRETVAVAVALSCVDRHLPSCSTTSESCNSRMRNVSSINGTSFSQCPSS